jgi:hypothetical protein
LYPIDNAKRTSENANMFVKNTELFKIFQEATRGIMIKILMDLDKAGFKLIIVDPEPGWHPKTINMSENERMDGLISLYKKLGLATIQCHSTTAARTALLFDDMSSIRQSMNKNNFDYDTPIMFGVIKNMLRTIQPNGFSGFLKSMISREVQKSEKFAQVKNYVISNFDNSDVIDIDTMDYIDSNGKKQQITNEDIRRFLKAKYESIISPPQTQMHTGGYHKKFLKYSEKYNRLNNKLNKANDRP